MKTGMQIRLTLLAWVMSGFANAAEYQAFASVLSVDPVIETRYEPVTRRICSEPDETARQFNQVAASIAEDIRLQARLWEQQYRCKNVTEQRAREHISGYRVTYRYGEEMDTTRLSYHPGERILVNVNLSPLP